MRKPDLGSIASTALICCALVSTFLVVRREVRASSPPAVMQQPIRRLPDSLWLAVRDGGWSAGDAAAPHHLVEFTDFECPACRRFTAALAGAKAMAGPNLRVTVRHLPLPYHRLAKLAAHAAECAGVQGRFWQMHDLLFAKGDSLGIKTIESFAHEAGVADSAAFRTCQQDQRFAGKIEDDVALAQAIGAPGTPAIVLDGVLEVGLTDSTRLRQRLRSLMDSLGRDL